MSLSPPAPRKKLHTREIVLEGYERADGLFEVEASLRDTKTYGYARRTGAWHEAGTPVHQMQVRVTFDLATMVIKQAEAATLAAPWGDCPMAGQNFHRLVGLSLGPGFLSAARERLGGPDGCTHQRELLQQIATTAIQSTFGRRANAAAAARKEGKASVNPRERLVGSCYAYREGGMALTQLLESGDLGPGKVEGA